MIDALPWNAIVERVRLAGAYGLAAEDPVLPGHYFAEIGANVQQVPTAMICPYCQGPMFAATVTGPGALASVRLVEGNGVAEHVRVFVDHLPDGESLCVCSACVQVFSVGSIL